MLAREIDGNCHILALAFLVVVVKTIVLVRPLSTGGN
jgi:hypothetical protein